MGSTDEDCKADIPGLANEKSGSEHGPGPSTTADRPSVFGPNSCESRQHEFALDADSASDQARDQPMTTKQAIEYRVRDLVFNWLADQVEDQVRVQGYRWFDDQIEDRVDDQVINRVFEEINR